ncbi:hypothetical protein [Bradyrhizobium sp. CCGUVB14]|uniref:hypothetical protein n=1 Tax=Bradyrhizobium sp. CCGUVB14 TaxID=2949628 RepID=UPI0020B24426|nr:hypothetical protein [Bradyrhizobium sp. CCGUVB14]MCP3446757.1 hypothetical protein [Bradyrhizobium sp. CCGUVB14]
MSALAVPKFAALNRFEGFWLYAVCQGLPTYAGVALTVKLMGASEIVGERYGAAIFVVIASTIHGLVTPWLGPKFPRFFKHTSEPMFLNAHLSFAEKVSCWLGQPKTALQLLTNVLLMSVMAVGVTSIR